MNDRPSKPLQLAVLSGLFAASLIWLAPMLNRPLWVDELHSSWVVSATWSELSDRARAGNQSVIYFALLKLIVDLCGQHEWSLRLPSLIAWIVGLLTLGAWLFRSNRQPGLVSCIPVVGWCLVVLVDQMQNFYAVEARSYALVQLLNLWSWIQVAEIVENCQTNCRYENHIYRYRHWYVWVICSGLMLAAHITSGLSLAFQTAILFAILIRRRQWSLVTIFVPVISHGVFQLFANQAAWNRRQQWASFAGDASWNLLIGLFPVMQIALPTILGLAIWLIWKRWMIPELKHLPSNKQEVFVVWFCAGLGPLVLAWLLTYLQIAPLMHYRFIIVAALPMYVCFAELGNLLPTWLRSTAVLTTLLWMISSQGLFELGLERWRNMRQEDWRGASNFIQQHFSSDAQSLWCYSGLIEAVDVKLPLTENQNRYLSYPVRGIHQIIDRRLPVEPHSLIADRKIWLKQILEQSNSDGRIQVWMIYRGPAERLKRDLENSGLSKFKLLHPPRSFDRVSVVCLDLSTKQ